MTRGISPNSLRQALGVIKDSTTVSLARVKKDYKELHVNIVKATSHIEQPAKEKHIRAIFAAISTTRPRADVAYCIHALERRLAKTHNWAVALKTLILIHRALKEVDPTFQEELVNYRMNNPTFLNLSHFKDYSNANACDYSYWIRMYASYMEQRLKCFRVLKYDLQTERSRTRDLDTPELFKHLQILQTLIIRILACKPIGAAVYNFVIRLALSMVASDSVKVYKAVSDATQNLVDKFFEMNQQDGFEAVDMYRRAGAQALSLSKFYETCKSFDIGCADGFIEIEPPSSSFIQVMEQYLEGLTCDSTVKKDLSVEENHGEILTIQHKKEAEIQAEPPPDLLSLDDPVEEADEQSANSVDKTAEWELALVSSPNSTEIAKSSTKLGTGLDKLTLYNLYNDAIKKTNQTMGYNPWDQHGPMMPPQTAPNPFHTFNMMVAPHMAPMDPLMPHQGSNPFANSYEDNTCIPHPYNTSVLVQPYNQYKCGPYMV